MYCNGADAKSSIFIIIYDFIMKKFTFSSIVDCRRCSYRNKRRRRIQSFTILVSDRWFFFFRQRNKNTYSFIILIRVEGNLKAENFFKKLTNDGSDNITDNTLIEWDTICISRAVANLSGSVIVQVKKSRRRRVIRVPTLRNEILSFDCSQEAIMEPLSCKMDSKRLLMNGGRANVENDRPIFDVNFNANKIRINVGQRDVRTLSTVWFDNVARIIELWGARLSIADIWRTVVDKIKNNAFDYFCREWNA